MIEKVKVVLKNGNAVTLPEWQKFYQLPIYSNQIGRHFSLSEARFQNDLALYGELIVNEQLITVLDYFREAVNTPITINSFNRTDVHQKELKERGFKTALYSPHVMKMAADIDTKSNEQTETWVQILKKISDKSGIKIRIGYKQYQAAGQTFIHVDVCPEYYATDKPYNKQFHPTAWEQVITW
jgi:hypothetical protein